MTNSEPLSMGDRVRYQAGHSQTTTPELEGKIGTVIGINPGNGVDIGHRIDWDDFPHPPRQGILRENLVKLDGRLEIMTGPLAGGKVGDRVRGTVTKSMGSIVGWRDGSQLDTTIQVKWDDIDEPVWEQERLIVLVREDTDHAEVTVPRAALTHDPFEDLCECNTGPNSDGPEETCLLHGRSKADWMLLHSEAVGQNQHLRRELEDWQKGHERVSNRRDELLQEVEDLKTTIEANEGRHQREIAKIMDTHDSRVSAVEAARAEARDRADKAEARAEEHLLRKQKVEVLLEEMELLRDKWRRDCLVARNQRDGLARARTKEEASDA